MNNLSERPWKLINVFSIVRILMHVVFIFINVFTIILYGNIENVEKFNIMSIIFFALAWIVDVIYVVNGTCINKLRFSPRRIAYSKEYTKYPFVYNLAVSICHGLLSVGSVFVNNTGMNLWVIALVVNVTLLIIFCLFYQNEYSKAITYLKNYDK